MCAAEIRRIKCSDCIDLTSYLCATDRKLCRSVIFVYICVLLLSDLSSRLAHGLQEVKQSAGTEILSLGIKNSNYQDPFSGKNQILFLMANENQVIRFKIQEKKY